MNPFMYGCVVEGEYFCPREKLERELRNYAARGQNVVVYGERRMGKTSLVRRAVSSLRGERLLYVDLHCIKTAADFCRRVMNGVAAVTEKMSFMKKALALAARLRPVLSIDSYTGLPSISIDAKAASEPDSVNTVMNALKKLAEECHLCVVFDEFQDVLQLEDSDRMLAELRGIIQLQAKTAYLFLGSVRNKMQMIFSDPNSPFFKSALPMEVGCIDEPAFVKFILSRFQKGRRKIAEETVRKVIEFAAGVSGDVQELCDALWEVTDEGEVVNDEDMVRALKVVFSREKVGYEAAVSDLTANQLSVLRGLAELKGVKVFSVEFMDHIHKQSPGAVNRALNALVARRLIYVYNREYRFASPFFREWLVREM